MKVGSQQMENIFQDKVKGKSWLWPLGGLVFTVAATYFFYANIKERQPVEHHEEQSVFLPTTKSRIEQAEVLLKEANKLFNSDPKRALVKAKQALVNTDLNDKEHNKIRTKILLLITSYYSTPQNLDKALLSQYGLAGLAASRSDKNIPLQIQFLSELGTGYGMLGDMKPAHNYLEEAYSLANSIGDKAAALTAVNGLAITKIELAKLDEATKLLQQGIKLAKELEQFQLELGLNHNLAVLYGKLNQPNKTIEIYQNLLERQKEPYLLGKIHSNLANNYLLIKKNKLAIEHALKALALYKESNNHLDDATAYSVLGRGHQAQKQYIKAEQYFVMALNMAKENEQYASVPFLHDSLSLFYAEIEQLDKAIIHGESAVALYRKQNRKVHLLDSLLSLSRIYEKSKNYEKAYKKHVEHKKLNDEVFAQDKVSAIDELNERFETDKKNQEIVFLRKINRVQQEKLNNEVVIKYAVIFLCLLIIGVVFLWYRHLHQKKQLQYEKERNQSLEKLDKTKDLFFASVTHELRTPVHAMMNLLNNEKQAVSGTDFQLLNYSCHRLSRIVDDIVDWSLIKSETLKLNITQVDISSVLNYAIKIASSQYRKPHVVIDNLLTTKTTMIQADESRLFQILCNLISNALKNTHLGYVRISASYESEKIIFMIKDTGKGLSKEQLNNAFKPFTSFDSHAKSMGLGLSICQQLARQHKGDLSIVSSSEEGTTVRLELPLVQETGGIITNRSGSLIYRKNNEDEIVQEQTVALERISGTYHILIVDDDLINCKTLSQLLNSLNYQVDYVQSAKECLIFLEKEAPDLLLVDIMMPEMDGINLCLAIRQHWTAINLPIIMLTARRQFDDLINCLACGANDFMTKPFLKEELNARISSQLSYKAQIKLQSENEHLKWEIQKNQKAEQALKTTKQRMEEILNHSRDCIFAVESDGLIIFANRKAEALIESSNNPSASINQRIFIENRALSFPLDESWLDKECSVQLTGKHYLMLITEFNQDESLYKITLQTVNTYDEDLSQKAMGGESLHDSASKYGGALGAKENDYRQRLVKLMNLCIRHWEKSTGESRMTLAEKSRIWRISIDGGRLRTRTLDRYMSFDSLPKNPKWRNVFRTAYYVLSNCRLDDNKKQEIDDLMHQISHYIDQGELISNSLLEKTN
ncbi:response regulator [Aliikangiella sp. IMCC44359]|uniref:response regulator n=1 Tax=Aliikangiella sp. IMCC44359 TaxID=3459125 RepID=UPI00403B060F